MDVPLLRLIMGAKSGSIAEQIESASWMFHQAPLAWELYWYRSYEEETDEAKKGVNYVREMSTFECFNAANLKISPSLIRVE